MLHGTVGKQPAINHHCRLVVEIEPCAGVESEGGAFSHAQSVENHVRAVGCEVRIFSHKRRVEPFHILPPSRNHHLLSHAIGNKFELILQENGIVVVGRVDKRLHKHENAVVAANFHIVKFLARHAIYVEVESPAAIAGNLD